MKIVAINGSPRKEGNTAALLKAVVEEHKDTDLVYFDLADLKVKDCTSCWYCKTHESCSIKDDMTKIYKAIKECDTLVLASPIYMGAETGIMKSMVDRMYALLSFSDSPGKFEPRLAPGKKAMALFTCGAPNGDTAMGYQKDRYYSIFAMGGFSKAKVYIVGGVNPNANIMEKVEVPKIIEESRRFLRH
ncbi:MAG: Iron-sulfur flavoprotein [Methanomassiliicoccales archaeon PtaU1.Bin124]|nr:MAG: Iron-sulfur flavoprotein [Methanomassiliicoccales archaeon PtaU1.Bin124]